MKKPAGFEKLSIALEDISRGPYPPAGFLPVWNAELGNGDHFGLYWPLGREGIEPIVCDMYHDEGGLRPAFSSVQKFVSWLGANDGERGDIEVEDDTFALKQFDLAKTFISAGSTEDAIRHLKAACETVPDLCEYWFALAGQLRRVGAHNESLAAALHAYRSGWHFGIPPDGVMRMLRGARDSPAFANDPIVLRIGDITAKYGGEKENRNYALLKECVDAYIDQAQPLYGLQMYHNYAYMMTTETTSFQERNGFNLQAWQDEFSELCGRYLGDKRSAVE